MSATNTVVVYNLPKDQITAIYDELSAIEILGLERITPIKFLRRMMFVFDSIDHAEEAFELLKEKTQHLAGRHVGYTIENNNPSIEEDFLKLPDPGTLLFISPPPSPPAEWVEFEEEEPNKRIHFEEDLNSKLQIALEEQQRIQNQTEQAESLQTPVSATDSSRTVMIMEGNLDLPALQLTQD
ncbi:hypothetical protein DASB73_027210 [Starmerella bacillaris]|uniref:Calcipressin-like protein n=1 Tax=Starmerella bacillaris TaxID=1247836 RepID=A0AAV5RKP9_STABA|nr:hypothetical protein DASB73_027210 [Starmerella bacillaris]